MYEDGGRYAVFESTEKDPVSVRVRVKSIPRGHLLSSLSLSLSLNSHSNLNPNPYRVSPSA
jgi:hypothetical protein